MPQTSTRSVEPDALAGTSLIAGQWVEPHGPAFHAVLPASGRRGTDPFYSASDDQVDAAGWRAWEAFCALADLPPPRRAALLDTAAALLEADRDALIATASAETALSPTRLFAEFERTTRTLRLFAELIRTGDWVQASIDTAEPSRRPLPKPHLRRMLRPIGPVAVFGASNFPLAYGVSGGDTASALAAGCPVIVKGHPAHPATGQRLARAFAHAVRDLALPPGTFAFLQCGPDRAEAIGRQLVLHRCVRAVGFTGSFQGGVALWRLALSRPDPIPVFAEMGSTNPVFLLEHALSRRADEIAERLAESATASNGQMCTCPGLIVLPASPDGRRLVQSLADRLNRRPPQPMLSPVVRQRYAQRLRDTLQIAGVEVRGGSPQAAHAARASSDASADQDGPVFASASLLACSFETFAANASLREEIFGPTAIAITCHSERELLDAASLIQGSLTGTIWATEDDLPLARQLLTILEQRVGRVIVNGVPTGVEVCQSMVHGGPFPATTAPQWTAVGPRAIERFCRPICYQNTPDELLPPELRDANPLGILRIVDGQLTRDPCRRGGA